LRSGAVVELRDGRGGAADATWLEGGQVRVAAVSPREPPSPAPLWLAVAAPRLPRLEWLIEKATELGVARLLLLDVTHGQHEVTANRLERLQRKADAALLQCGRRHGMALDGPLTLGRALAEAGPVSAGLWIADPQAESPPPALRPCAPLLALVGPEGGFSPAEADAARAAGALPVRLGPHVLRVETAGLALAAWASTCAIQG
jgi:16S rRNA (uracil1498-N3)-methyltransferase